MLTDNIMAADPISRPSKNIVVLLSGSGSNLQAIINACSSGQIQGRISAVISNRPAVFGLERATKSHIPTQLIDHQLHASREGFEAALIAQIDSYQPDLLVLAGFMRILTASFVDHYQGRLLNIHPSLLPAYKGINTHQRALNDGVAEHGASVHFVAPALDGGPVIIQARVPVLARDNVQSLAQRVLGKEHIIYPQAIAWFCADRLHMNPADSSIRLDNQILSTPLIWGSDNPALPITPW